MAKKPAKKKEKSSPTPRIIGIDECPVYFADVIHAAQVGLDSGIYTVLTFYQSLPSVSTGEQECHARTRVQLPLNVSAQLPGILTGQMMRAMEEQRNAVEVQSFLLRYPKIQQFLEAVNADIVDYFDTPVTVVLELIRYPYEESYENLVGWIQSHDEVGDGLEKLDRFSDSISDKARGVDSLFHFNIEFSEP